MAAEIKKKINHKAPYPTVPPHTKNKKRLYHQLDQLNSLKQHADYLLSYLLSMYESVAASQPSIQHTAAANLPDFIYLLNLPLHISLF